MTEPQVVHVCRACAHITFRHQMTNAEIVSGVIQCPACGKAGPLNVEVIDVSERKPPAAVDRESKEP